MGDASEKGLALERAVLAIEKSILQASPSLKDGAFRIETRQIVHVSGVRHEIDLWVRVDPAPGYSADFIFECKNWTKKVGKNEVVLFSHKVNALQAQRGFLVGCAFTRDARAQAACDPRIELVEARESLLEDLQVPMRFHVLAVENQKATVNFMERGSPAGGTSRLIESGARAVLNGSEIDLAAFLTKWRDETSNERSNRFPSQTLPAGIYPLEAESVREFEPNSFLLADRDIEKGTLTMTFTAEVIRPAIVSTFEVAGRGRVWHLAPVKLGGGELKAAIVGVGDFQLETMPVQT